MYSPGRLPGLFNALLQLSFCKGDNRQLQKEKDAKRTKYRNPPIGNKLRKMCVCGGQKAKTVQFA
jgi:hypothetical protein